MTKEEIMNILGIDEAMIQQLIVINGGNAFLVMTNLEKMANIKKEEK